MRLMTVTLLFKPQLSIVSIPNTADFYNVRTVEQGNSSGQEPIY